MYTYPVIVHNFDTKSDLYTNLYFKSKSRCEKDCKTEISKRELKSDSRQIF